MLKSSINETKGDKVFNIVNYSILFAILVVIAYPLIFIVSASFSDSLALIQGRVWLFPVDFSLDGYKAIVDHRGINMGYLNSFFYMFVGTIVNIVFTVMVAYPLSRQDLRLRKFFTLLIVFTMIFNAGLIPTYMLIRQLGLINSRLVLIIPKAVNAWNVMVTITYFRTSIPKDLLEAARIDGCSDINFLCRIVLPLSKPILAVIGLFYAVTHWNAYFDAMIYLSDKTKFPLQIILRDILIQNQIGTDLAMTADPETLLMRENLALLLKYSLIVVSSIPLMILYPFVQKYFVKGVMVGSVKG
ncbi:carbohydrate ABC transporter permease [Vallitalea okinawensis]|uniref:carbohydrate ABC transporter permease n=1 Tax=Vallitalea okinawensis TaxID=2078660 RepID=UPI000CFE3339|nr:carbohydrate ABC transporter permease [Vallitalea okinawensis]